jgi:hypothetical protein
LLPDYKYITTPLPKNGNDSPHTKTTVVVILEQFCDIAPSIYNFSGQIKYICVTFLRLRRMKSRLHRSSGGFEVDGLLIFLSGNKSGGKQATMKDKEVPSFSVDTFFKQSCAISEVPLFASLKKGRVLFQLQQ